MLVSQTSRPWRRSLAWGVLGLVLGFAEAQNGLPWTTTPSPTPESTATFGMVIPSTAPKQSQPTSHWSIPGNVTLSIPGSFSYMLASLADNAPLQLLLCWTNATIPNQPPTQDDLFFVDQVQVCQNRTAFGLECLGIYPENTPVTVPYHLEPGESYNSSELSNFFFCFGTRGATENTVCEYSSPYFDIRDRPILNNLVKARDTIIQTPSAIQTTVTISKTSLLITHQGTFTLSVSPSTSSSSISATTTQPLSTTATSTTSPSATATASPIPGVSKSSSSGLSTGAKVGIALGSLVIVALLLLLALFFLRRKHAQRKNQAAATHPLHTDSFPHSALIAEKDDSSPSTIIPIPDPLLAPRHSDTHIPYTAVPSSTTPPTTTTTTYNTGVPKRKPTANTVTSTISRGLSTISRSSGPSASGSGVTSSSNFESYRDAAGSGGGGGGRSPTYGDARQSPQLFTSDALREEGMTAEEVARLEEEERRIDAAIAEAERR